MSVGRIETYLHSDKTTQNKGGVLVRVTSSSDFGAKTPEFIGFAQKVAKMAYGFGALDLSATDEHGATLTWDDLIETMGLPGVALEAERVALAKTLKETITVAEIVILTL